jgi:hypothetical protein
MKKLKLFCLLFTFLILASCKKNESDPTVKESEFVSVQCYNAIFEKDSIDVKINTLEDGKITGSMKMHVFNKPNMIGELSGEVRGDTLFTSYTYYEEGNKSKTYKNPMAFLKRGNELILGNGKIDYALGGSYFVKDQPIDFDNVKYNFITIECPDK